MLPGRGASRKMAFPRFVANGLVATAAHYAVLLIAMEVASMPSAALANLLASIFGITASFIGNRYFVFRSTEASMMAQGVKFLGLYGLIAMLNGGVMFLVTDYLGYHYNIGFICALVLQVWLGYTAGKHVVFRKQPA